MRKHVFCIVAMVLLACGFFLWSVSGAQEAKINPAYQQVIEKLGSLQPGKTIAVNMGTQKEQYDFGEPFEIRFMASQESYIMLMHISAEGTITFFAPSRQIPPNTRIKEGKVYSTGVYPGPKSEEEKLYDFGLKLTTARPGGTETINLFCSTKKIDLFTADFEKEPFYTIAPSDEKRLQALSDRLDQLQQSEWSGGSIKIKIGPELKPKFDVRAAAKQISRKFGALPPISSTGTTGKFFPPIGSTGTTGKTDKEEVN